MEGAVTIASDVAIVQTTLPLPDELCLQDIYARLPLEDSGTAVLDSAGEPSPRGRFPLARYSIIAQEPFGILEAQADGAWWHTTAGSEFLAGDPLHLLQCVLERYRLPVECASVPFPAGAVGFLNYGLKALLEPCPNRLPALSRLPLFRFAFYDAIATIDLHRREVVFSSTGLPEVGARRVIRASRHTNGWSSYWHDGRRFCEARTRSAFRCFGRGECRGSGAVTNIRKRCIG